MPPKKKVEKVAADKRCPMDTIFYVLATATIMMYGIYLYDTSRFMTYSEDYSFLRPFASFFQLVEKYSPFHEYLVDDVDQGAERKTDDDVVMTKDQLALYDGSDGSPGLYLAFLGQIFDVSKAPKYYGPDGGYSFFAAKDASRAFITGQFDEAGLHDDVIGLTQSDYGGIEEWLNFYHKDYTYVGKLAGRYFDNYGSPTDYYRQVQKLIEDARTASNNYEAEKRIFPPCNSEWSSEKGQRVWCTKKSGGIDRDWIGVPRRLFFPGRKERCACVKNFGESLYFQKETGNRGDLDNPHLKTFELCPDLTATSCQVSEPEA